MDCQSSLLTGEDGGNQEDDNDDKSVSIISKYSLYFFTTIINKMAIIACIPQLYDEREGSVLVDDGHVHCEGSSGGENPLQGDHGIQM